MSFRPSRRSLVLLAAAALVLGTVPMVPAAAGAAELTLDRAAVAALIAAQMPGPVVVAMPPLGRMTVQLTPPQTVDFVDGGVVGRFGINILETGGTGTALVRLFPDVDRTGRVVRLRAMSVSGEGPLAMVPDFSQLLPPITMQSVFEFGMVAQSGVETPATVEVQNVFVKKDRLEIRMGLVTRPPKGAR